MKFIILASAAAAALAIAPAAAQVAQPAPAPAPRQFAPKVETRAEVSAHVAQMFAKLDANRDGYVTTAELDAQKAQHAGKMHQRVEQRGAKAFERLDANKDGQISRQEWDSGRQMRVEHRAMIGQFGMRHAGMRGGFGSHMLAMADLNKDGRVTLAEAQQAALAHFDSADLNRDGRLTPEERRQVRQQMRVQRRPS